MKLCSNARQLHSTWVRVMALWGALMALTTMPLRANEKQPTTTGDYELTVAVAQQALLGWQLHRAGTHQGDFLDGHYTDTRPDTPARDFWSNGRYATLDRDENGHAETVFLVRDGTLVYMGSLGRQGTFVDTAKPFAAAHGVTKGSLIRLLEQFR